MASESDVQEAEAQLAEAKQNYYDNDRAEEFFDEFDAAKRHVVEVRKAWRQEQEANGSRVGFVGGDVERTEG